MSAWSAAGGQAPAAKPLAYLEKHVGQEPYDLWKTQPLERRLKALLGPEYPSLIANLDPASELEEQNGVLHTEGNAPHRGGEEEAVLLIDVPNDTLEVFLRHQETVVAAFAEHGRTVVIPREAMERMRRWPRPALAQALAKLQSASQSGPVAARNAAESATGRGASARTADLCQAGASCYETNSFAATVNDFRTSTTERTRMLTANIRIVNKLNRPLTLGLVQGSGVGIDDQGNRYGLDGGNGVRGIGLITSSSSVDTKFTLQPGESGDARVEMVLPMAHNVVYGTSFQLSMTLREIDALGATQLRLGREYEVRFPPMANGLRAPASGTAIAARTAGSPVMGAGTPYNGTQPVEVAAIADACGTTPRCYSSGPILATIGQVAASSVGNFKDHMLRVDVKFRNLSSQPVVLAYASGTSTAIDNLGNTYSWGRPGTHDVSAQGIGVTTGSSADPRFVLQPGETRNATFQVIRYRPGNAPLGNSFTYNLTVQQLEILPSQQIRTAREYSMNFTNLNAGFAPAQGLGESIRKLGDLLGKRK